MTALTLRRDMAAERARGRVAIDSIYLPQLAALMTPAASIRSLKAAEAGRLLAGAIETSPLLSAEAAQRGIAEVEFAGMVLDRAATTSEQIAAVETARQAAQAAIDAAASPVAIDDILRQHR